MLQLFLHGCGLRDLDRRNVSGEGGRKEGEGERDSENGGGGGEREKMNENKNVRMKGLERAYRISAWCLITL